MMKINNKQWNKSRVWRSMIILSPSLSIYKAQFQTALATLSPAHAPSKVLDRAVKKTFSHSLLLEHFEYNLNGPIIKHFESQLDTNKGRADTIDFK